MYNSTLTIFYWLAIGLTDLVFTVACALLIWAVFLRRRDKTAKHETEDKSSPDKQSDQEVPGKRQ